MDEKTVSKLNQPFPAEVIRYREGQDGKRLSYVEAARFVVRLNEALGHDWSFEIVRREVTATEVLVETKLITGAIVKSAVGSAELRRDYGGKVNLGDAIKAAESDALKRAARLLGVGLGLWLDDAEEVRPQAAAAHAPGNNGERRGPTPTGNRDRISGPQLALVRRLAGEGGIDRQRLNQMATERYGCVPEFLNRQAASEFIDALKCDATVPERAVVRGGRR